MSRSPKKSDFGNGGLIQPLAVELALPVRLESVVLVVHLA